MKTNKIKSEPTSVPPSSLKKLFSFIMEVMLEISEQGFFRART